MMMAEIKFSTCAGKDFARIAFSDFRFNTKALLKSGGIIDN